MHQASHADCIPQSTHTHTHTQHKTHTEWRTQFDFYVLSSNFTLADASTLESLFFLRTHGPHCSWRAVVLFFFFTRFFSCATWCVYFVTVCSCHFLLSLHLPLDQASILIYSILYFVCISLSCVRFAIALLSSVSLFRCRLFFLLLSTRLEDTQTLVYLHKQQLR